MAKYVQVWDENRKRFVKLATGGGNSFEYPIIKGYFQDGNFFEEGTQDEIQENDKKYLYYDVDKKRLYYKTSNVSNKYEELSTGDISDWNYIEDDMLDENGEIPFDDFIDTKVYYRLDGVIQNIIQGYDGSVPSLIFLRVFKLVDDTIVQELKLWSKGGKPIIAYRMGTQENPDSTDYTWGTWKKQGNDLPENLAFVDTEDAEGNVYNKEQVDSIKHFVKTFLEFPENPTNGRIIHLLYNDDENMPADAIKIDGYGTAGYWEWNGIIWKQLLTTNTASGNWSHETASGNFPTN